MLTQVVVETSNPMTFNIESADPDEILIITSISGLDPADLTLFTGDFARDGGYYQGRRTGKRNPVIYFKINPNYADDIDVSDIREMIYRTFLEPLPDSDGVQVRLVDSKKPDRYFIGYVEKLPSEIFAQNPTAQVSMICVDPYIKSVDETTFTDATGVASTPITYDGSADVGMEITLKVKTATNTITVDKDGSIMQLVKASDNFAVNDVVTINTVIGSRSIKQNGNDVMATLTAASTWITLDRETNTLKAYGSADGDGSVAITGYTFQSNWWGI